MTGVITFLILWQILSYFTFRREFKFERSFHDLYLLEVAFLRSKRKSLALEEDLKYRNEMESSVFDRLRQFKETEHKSKENLEVIIRHLAIIPAGANDFCVNIEKSN